MVLGSALAVCSIILIVRGWASKQAWIAFSVWVRSPKHASSFLVVVASLVFFAFSAGSLGYHVAVFICMLAMLLKLGNSLRSSLLIAAAVATLSHLFFYKALRVPLPWGVLPVIY